MIDVLLPQEVPLCTRFWSLMMKRILSPRWRSISRPRATGCCPPATGKRPLAAAAREDVHLILMDIMMPVMDGLSAMAQLRQTSNVPVILLTAKGEDTDKVLGLNVGADDYITKPFNPVELLARVRSQLRRYLQLGGGQVQASTLIIGGICLMTTPRPSPWTATRWR